MASEDVLDHVALGEGIVERQIGAAGNSGDLANALLFQQADGQLGS